MNVTGNYAEALDQGQTPQWAHRAEISLDAPPPTQTAAGGIWQILFDTQHNLEERTIYRRFARKLLTQAGVQEGSRVEIGFDPMSEQISIHELTLHRDGQTIDLRASQEIQILNLEQGLERHVFDGRLLAVCLLKDTRVGDVIELAYSSKKLKRLNNERSFGRFLLRGPVTVQFIRNRLLYAPERQVQTLPINHTGVPEVSSNGNGLTVCQWTSRNEPAALPEDNLPNWYDPFSWVEYSEYNSWNEVARWASELFQLGNETPPEMTECIRTIQSTTSIPHEQISAALRFVQDNIRYVAVSVGEHSVRPYDVSTILERRYGDCKDKSLLLTNILKAMGFDAAPALVHSVRRHRISTSTPNPGAFDHAIVQIRHENKTYWVDPTIAGQRGAIEKMYCPEYGKALVIASDSTELSNVATASGTGRIRISDSFFCGRLTQLTEYTVTRVYEGAQADQMRTIIANTGHEQLTQAFLAEYLPLYPSIKVVHPWKHVDDERKNILKILLSYCIDDLWKPAPNQPGVQYAHFHCGGLSKFLYNPVSRTRQAPFAIPHPLVFEQQLNVRINRPFRLTRDNFSFDCPAFQCRGSASTQSADFHLDFQYTSRKDHVTPKEVEDYLKHVTKLVSLMTQTLWFQSIYAPESPGR